MNNSFGVPDGYKLVPCEMTDDQVAAVLGDCYTPTCSRMLRAQYALCVDAAPETELPLMREICNFIESLPVVTDGAVSLLYKIENALGVVAGPDTHSARRTRRILNAEQASEV